MPNIQEYERQIDGLSISNAGVDAAVQLGNAQARTSAHIGQKIAEGIEGATKLYVEYADKKEASQGGALYAKTLDNLTSTWNNQVKDSDLNDGTIGTKFREETLEPALEAFVGSFNSSKNREWAQTQADRIRLHFYDKLQSDDAGRSEAAAIQNVFEFANDLGNTVYKSPETLDLVLGSVDEHLSVVAGPLSLDAKGVINLRNKGLEIKAGLVGAAMKGMMDEDPRAFLADLEAGEFSEYEKYLDADKRAALRAAAGVKIKAAEEDERVAIREARAVKDREANAKANILFQSAVRADGSVVLPPNFFGDVTKISEKDPELDKDFTSSLFAAGRAIAKDAADGITVVDDPSVYEQFRKRAFLPESDPRALTAKEVNQAIVSRLLSPKSHSMFLNAIDEKVRNPDAKREADDFDTWVASMKKSITDDSMLTSGSSQSLNMWGDFQRDMKDRYYLGLRSGLKKEDMFDRASKNYIAIDINRYQFDSKTGMRYMLMKLGEGSELPPSPSQNVVSPESIKRLPGEGFEAFLSRKAKAVEAAKSAFAPPLAPKEPTLTLFEFDQRFSAGE